MRVSAITAAAVSVVLSGCNALGGGSTTFQVVEINDSATLASKDGKIEPGYYLEIINASDCYLELAVNGIRLVASKDNLSKEDLVRLTPGASTAVVLKSGASERTPVIVSAKSWSAAEGGRLVGLPELKRFVLSGGTTQTNVWIVVNSAPAASATPAVTSAATP